MDSELLNPGLEPCVSCGAEVAANARSYAFGEESVICMECALRRGGTYDELEDRWTAAPYVDDLLQSLESAQK